MDSQTVVMESSIFAVVLVAFIAFVRIIRESECSTKAGSTKINFTLKKKNRDGEGKPGIFTLGVVDTAEGKPKDRPPPKNLPNV